MTEILPYVAILVLVALAILASGLYVGALFGVGAIGRSKRSSDLRFRLRYRVVSLPCAYCRDAFDRPTGKTRPQSRAALEQVGGDESKLPAFDCSACGGTKKIRYEVDKRAVLDITEDGRLAGVSVGEAKQVSG